MDAIINRLYRLFKKDSTTTKYQAFKSFVTFKRPSAMSIQAFLRGYLCYKTITSQNVPSKAQIKDFFRRKIMFRSQDIQVFVFLTIP